MGAKENKGRMFCFVVDGTQYERKHPLVTAGEIMDIAGIPREVGLIYIEPNGTHRVVPDDERFNLAKLAGKFKRCPQFKRG
ncbi:MAG: hypothetical protein ACOC7K_01805 [bacterium]